MLLDCLKEQLTKKKKRKMAQTGAQDNATSQKSTIVTKKSHEFGLLYRFLNHNVLRIWPRFIFPAANLDLRLGGKKSVPSEDAITAASAYFAALAIDDSHLCDGIKNLEAWWSKCQSLRRDYVEK